MPRSAMWRRWLRDCCGESDRSKRLVSNPVEAEISDQINELYRQIGQLKVERDFLAIRSARLGLPTEVPPGNCLTLQVHLSGSRYRDV
jgi:transposase